MKIVQISTYDIRGGAARAAYRLHQGLLGIGEDCRMLVKHKETACDSVFAITPTSPAASQDESLFLGKFIQEYYLDSHRTEISNTPFSLPYPGHDLSVLPLVQKADILNLHWVARDYQSPTTLQSLFALGKPVVWTLHDQSAFTGGCHYSAGCGKYRRDCMACPQLADDPFHLPAAILKDKSQLFQGANLTIVTPSQWLAACAKESWLLKDRRIEVIANSLETDIFSPLPKAKAKANFGLPAETITLLFGAEFVDVDRKGLRELMAAIRLCLEDTKFKELVADDKIRLLCFGRANEDLDGLGVPLVPLGYLDSDEAIRYAYAAADLFILPSLEDNLPNTMLEAMSCGTPIVGFDVGGIPDAVTHGITGQLAPAGDARQLGQAMLSLVFDPDRREEMGQICRSTALEKYALSVQARNYTDLYRELCQAPKMTVRFGRERDNAQMQEEDSPSPPLPVPLETTLGPHFQRIYDQVLFKALKECAPSMYGALDGVHRQPDNPVAGNRNLNFELDQLRRQLKNLTTQNTYLRLQLSQIRNSWSWKITAPLRAMPFRRAAEILAKLKR